MKQRFHNFRIAIAAFSILLGWGSPVGAREIRIGLSATADPENSGIYVWARTFADELERAGMVTTIYPSSTLGNEIVRTEQILLGLLEVNVTGTQEVEVYSELVVALDLPFLFKSDEEANALMHHTGYLSEMNSETRPVGMRVVNLVGMGGSSGLFTARAPIETVADVKKFRIRAMSNEQLDWVDAWGGAGTQVAWEEVPQAPASPMVTSTRQWWRYCSGTVGNSTTLPIWRYRPLFGWSYFRKPGTRGCQRRSGLWLTVPQVRPTSQTANG